MAMPVATAPSASVMPLVKALMSEPTAPLGKPASSATVMLNDASANTGASLTAVTVIATVSLSVAPSASVESTVSVSAPLKWLAPW